MDCLVDLIARRVPYSSPSQSKTIKDLEFLQNLVLNVYQENEGNENAVKLQRSDLIKYLHQTFRGIPERYISYTASQPWFVFYILHSLELLGVMFDNNNLHFIYNILEGCKNSDGGFGGGPRQESHLGCTFAAICCLLIIGSYYDRAMDLVNTSDLIKFIRKCRNNDGSYRISPKHEVDIRAIYCAIASTKLTNSFMPNLFVNTAEYIAKCQNYDGGIGAFPGAESHAGYTYCAYASLVMLNEEDRIDKARLLDWVVRRQMTFEGGFTGRCNKMVDTCYSFWCGSLVPIIQASVDLFMDTGSHKLINREANQYYLLLASQVKGGGFTDRPPHLADPYHTCYGLSSLSLCQHSFIVDHDNTGPVGDPGNFLEKVHPLYNISHRVYGFALKKFY